MLSLGMSWDEYWYGDVGIAKKYYEAEKLRQERVNSEAWLNGIYTLSALQATVGNLFKEKNDKPFEYPTQPIEFNANKQQESEEAVQRREEQEVAFAKLYMENLLRVGKDWGKNREDSIAPKA